MKKSIYQITIALLLMALLATQVKAENSDSSLYQKLGGQETIELITKNLLIRLFDDDRIAFLFKDADKVDLHQKIVDQICMETGGPCQYEGLNMVESHGGFEIKYSEFDAFVEDFILALEDAKVPFRLQNKVLAIFAPMREDITYK
jgi:hemoglobin